MAKNNQQDFENSIETIPSEKLDRIISGNGENSIELVEKNGVLAKIMDYLSLNQRDVLKYRYFDGKTLQEIGDKLNCSRQNVAQVEKIALTKAREIYRTLECGGTYIIRAS